MDWKYYWLKGKENLEIAALAYQGKRYNACASSTYYAVFLASVAALIKLTDFRAKDNEWQHGQVQAELNRQLIMRKKLLPGVLISSACDQFLRGLVPPCAHIRIQPLRHSRI